MICLVGTPILLYNLQSYRQPQTKASYEKSRPIYSYQKRRTLEDLVDPQLLNRIGGTLQVQKIKVICIAFQISIIR